MILSALRNSSCLPKLTLFNCSINKSWFNEGKESNVELLMLALSNMTAVEEINLRVIKLNSSGACDKLMETLIANQAKNLNLK